MPVTGLVQEAPAHAPMAATMQGNASKHSIFVLRKDICWTMAAYGNEGTPASGPLMGMSTLCPVDTAQVNVTHRQAQTLSAKERAVEML